MEQSYVSEWLSSQVDRVIIDLNVRFLSGQEPYEYLFYGLSSEERRNDGRLKDRWLNRYRHVEAGGWWCSGTNLLDGKDSLWGCFKPLQPRQDCHRHKVIKYEHPPHIPTEIFALKASDRIWEEIAERFGVKVAGETFWGWVLASSRLPLLITEGAKKAGALLSAGYAAIALPGINNGYRNDGDRALIPQLLALSHNPREFVFVFDSDKRLKTQEAVTQAILTTGKLLEKRSGKVSVCEWDYRLGKGVDDLIAAQGVERFEAIFEQRIRLSEYAEGKKQKTIYLDAARLLEFMQAEFEDRLSFDELKCEVLLDGQPLKLANELKPWFIETFGYNCGKEDLLGSITYLAQKNTFNPVKRYLETCYRDSQRVSIDNLATRYLGTNDPLYDEMLKRWLIGAVARVFSPGCQMDYALVLQGKQGIFKSTFFKVLGGTWFDDSLKDISADDALLILDRCWIQEMAEFERITKKKEVEDVKAFITRTIDTFRKRYDREASEHPRRSVLCGSVNKASFLLDETGNRRLWVIPIPESQGQIDIEMLAEERDGIWAAAVDARLAGEKPMLSPEMEWRSAANNKQFEVYDEWEGEIEHYLEGREAVSIAEILSQAFDLEPAEHDRPFQMRVSSILVKLGWQKIGPRNHQGRKQQVWEKLMNKESIDEFAKYPSSAYIGKRLIQVDPATDSSGENPELERVSGVDQPFEENQRLIRFSTNVQNVTPVPTGSTSPKRLIRLETQSGQAIEEERINLDQPFSRKPQTVTFSQNNVSL